MTLAEFLLARIAEDERAAQVATGYPSESSGWLYGGTSGSYIGFHDRAGSPTRVLAECEAKRRILHIHGEDNLHGTPGNEFCANCERDSNWPCHTVAALASIYVDHPDYRQEWTP